MISMLYKIYSNPYVTIMAAGLLLMCLSAVSIDVVSIAYGYGFDQFDMATSASIGDLSVIELMTEFTMPITFICGVFLVAGGLSGLLLIDSSHSGEFGLL